MVKPIKKSGYVILEGNIGVGKSTFSAILAEELQKLGCNAEYLPEPDESTNPFLADYYAHPKETAYKMQLHLLHQRFKSTQYAQTAALDGRGWYILDRSYYGDICFARVQVRDGFFTRDELLSYLDAHRNMRRFIEPPSAAVFLMASPNVCAARIRKRARECEAGVPIEYLEKLDDEIRRLAGILEARCPVLRMPWDDERSVEELYDEARLLAVRLTDGHRDDWDF